MRLSVTASLAAGRAAFVATCAHCVADGNLILAIVALPLLVAAGVVTRRAGGLPIPRRLTNLLLLAVMGLALVRARAGGAVVSDAVQLVVAVMVVKMFERKASRDLALVLMLSIFVVIGAILTDNGLLTSVLVIVALPLVVWGVTLQQLFAAQEHAAARSAPDLAVVDRTPGEWSLNGESGVRARADLRRLVALVLLASTVVGVVVFLLVPRGIGMNRLTEWAGTGVGRQVGFNDEIHLGTGGFLQDSDAPVMDVTIREADGQRLGGPGILYYLRGAVLDTYHNASWRAGSDAARRSRVRYEPDVPVYLDSGGGARLTIEVTIRNAPNGTTHLFTLWRPVQIEIDRSGALEITPASVLTTSTRGGRVEYTVHAVTTPFFRGPAESRTPVVLFGSEVIRARAASILEGVGLSADPARRPPSEDARAARAIEQFLRTGYAYTREAHAAPAGAHPIEWFIETSKRGHCEDFASAMVALCRAAGINSRIVTGYVAAEFNPSSEHYIVRQGNAHAWVEVEAGQGRWREFDPTPPEELSAIHSPRATFASRARQFLDAIEYAWINSVVSFDQSRQDRLFRTGPSGQGGPLAFLESIRRRSVGTREVLAAALTGVVVFVSVALAGFALRSALRFLPRRGRLWTLLGRTRGGDLPHWYEEYLRRTARAGYPKPVWCPPLEHAEALGRIDPALGEAAATIARSLYVARYSGVVLTGEDDDRIRASLDRLGERLTLVRAIGRSRGVAPTG